MYRCIKLKHSVSPRLSVINSYAQQLHVASKMLLRRKLSNTMPADQEFNQFEDNSKLPLTNQDYSVDFLGIESDEGVITLNPHKTPMTKNIQKLKNKEKFYRTTYGVVRLDSDNKIKRHGQYNKEFEFPHKSHDRAVVLKGLPHLAAKSVSTSEITNCNDVHENIELHENQKKTVTRSYIDEVYFGNITEKKNVNSYDKVIQKSPDKLNFLDKNYFSALTDSETSDSSQNSITEGKENLCISGEHSANKPECVNQLDLKDLNVFDSMFFENANVSNSAVNLDLQNFSKEDFSDEISSHNSGEMLGVKVDETFSNNESNADMKPFIELKNDDILPSEKRNDCFKKYSTSNYFDVSPKINHENQYNRKLNRNNENFNESVENGTNEMLKSSAKKFSEKKDQNHKYSDSNVTALNSFTREKRNKFSSTNSKEDHKEDAVQEDISTAHDFITKLRKEQEIPQTTIRKEKDLTKIKFDSKGFRILKNQVVDLSYFTRNEILDLLVKNVVYSDNDLILLNKPYGLVIHESQTTKEPCLSTFLNDLAEKIDPNSSDSKLLTVHRIDKETTGCLLLARTEIMAQQLKSLFAQRKIIKKYWIITSRVPDPSEGTIDIPISEGSIDNKKRMVLHPKLPKDLEFKNHSKRGKEAITSYRVLSESGNAALVEVVPKTGIKHQIRVHFGFGLSCPILGDHKYSHLDKLAPQVLQNDVLERLHVRQSKVRYIPMHIHARTVIIPKYFEDRDLVVNIPLPEHMKQNLKMLKFRKKDMS